LLCFLSTMVFFPPSPPSQLLSVLRQLAPYTCFSFIPHCQSADYSFIPYSATSFLGTPSRPPSHFLSLVRFFSLPPHQVFPYIKSIGPLTPDVSLLHFLEKLPLRLRWLRPSPWSILLLSHVEDRVSSFSFSKGGLDRDPQLTLKQILRQSTGTAVKSGESTATPDLLSFPFPTLGQIQDATLPSNSFFETDRPENIPVFSTPLPVPYFCFGPNFPGNKLESVVWIIAPLLEVF